MSAVVSTGGVRDWPGQEAEAEHFVPCYHRPQLQGGISQLSLLGVRHGRQLGFWMVYMCVVAFLPRKVLHPSAITSHTESVTAL